MKLTTPLDAKLVASKNGIDAFFVPATGQVFVESAAEGTRLVEGITAELVKQLYVLENSEQPALAQKECECVSLLTELLTHAKFTPGAAKALCPKRIWDKVEALVKERKKS